jgi:8-oxo-dGTP pyrophosphatase MutT (NUDIX family)
MKTKYVLVFLFGIDLKTILLIRKCRPDWQSGKLNGLGGHIDGEESAKVAAIREVREECNVDLREYELENVELVKGEKYEIHVFAARANLSQWRTMTDETAECVALPRLLDKPDQFVSDALRLALKSLCILSN